jgi:hypothetical protein
MGSIHHGNCVCAAAAVSAVQSASEVPALAILTASVAPQSTAHSSWHATTSTLLSRTGYPSGSWSHADFRSG